MRNITFLSDALDIMDDLDNTIKGIISSLTSEKLLLAIQKMNDDNRIKIELPENTDDENIHEGLKGLLIQLGKKKKYLLMALGLKRFFKQFDLMYAYRKSLGRSCLTNTNSYLNNSVSAALEIQIEKRKGNASPLETLLSSEDLSEADILRGFHLIRQGDNVLATDRMGKSWLHKLLLSEFKIKNTGSLLLGEAPWLIPGYRNDPFNGWISLSIYPSLPTGFIRLSEGDQQALLKVKDKKYQTPLKALLCSNLPDFVKCTSGNLLTRLGANPFETDYNGNTWFHMAFLLIEKEFNPAHETEIEVSFVKFKRIFGESSPIESFFDSVQYHFDMLSQEDQSTLLKAKNDQEQTPLKAVLCSKLPLRTKLIRGLCLIQKYNANPYETDLKGNTWLHLVFFLKRRTTSSQFISFFNVHVYPNLNNATSIEGFLYHFVKLPEATQSLLLGTKNNEEQTPLEQARSLGFSLEYIQGLKLNADGPVDLQDEQGEDNDKHLKRD